MNKGGRPQKKDDELKKHKFSIYFNSEEYNYLQRKNMLNSSKIVYILIKSLEKKTFVIETDKDPKYLLELNRIGNNLNQITKRLNSIKDLSSLDIEKLNNILSLINQKLSNDS